MSAEFIRPDYTKNQSDSAWKSMSAIGTKQTSVCVSSMFCFGGKAGIVRT